MRMELMMMRRMKSIRILMRGCFGMGRERGFWGLGNFLGRKKGDVALKGEARKFRKEGKRVSCWWEKFWRKSEWVFLKRGGVGLEGFWMLRLVDEVF